MLKWGRHRVPGRKKEAFDVPEDVELDKRDAAAR